MDISKLIPDESKSLEGSIFDYTTPQGVVKVRLAMAGNKNFSKTFQSKLREATRKNPALRNDVEFTTHLSMEAMAETVILDIEGMTSGDQPLKYTPELGVKILESNPAFRLFVNENAGEIENYIKEAADNSADLKSVPVMATKPG